MVAEKSAAMDVLILSNGPGEVTTWVRPVVRELRRQLGDDRDRLRISVILAPCNNASGQEAAIARRFPEVDRVQGAEHFFPFLLAGKTAESWDWRDRGVVLFLGGDQFFPVVIGKRLGYRIVIYGEWDARWPRWVDRFGVAREDIAARAPKAYRHKYQVIGNLMSDAAAVLRDQSESPLSPEAEWIGLLPGSKAAKLAQGVPLVLAIAEHLHRDRPQTRFVLPVAPTLSLPELARFADPQQNPIVKLIAGSSAQLILPPEGSGDRPRLRTENGLEVELWTTSPAYDVLANCRLCLTTVGANTAELGSLGVPMMVLLPTQQIDAMRSWDGLPGLLANLPGVGTLFAVLINRWFLRRSRLLAWPNILASEEIVPELLGELKAEEVAAKAAHYLSHPETLATMRDRLLQVWGQSGAVTKLVHIVAEELAQSTASG
ncbi:lipid-A-disaccharide synthase [Geitlerinema sp. PCC 7407]|uniref:lipid-A-disaccharide synthase n=1 Tax=Geitlerinema sp. PCC 7407 TaxID=1173025 RepID=UPI00029F944A|nr:lipid-A-disaccharide synthase [Geitlerinema sp. PCC 7407]AFY66546.1 putative lipid-A-disaccharide synthase [Geitlerinema sp. PCC 7407]